MSPSATITLGDHDALDLAKLVEQLDGASSTKINSAGPTVHPVSSGHGRAIMFADMAWRGDVIKPDPVFPCLIAPRSTQHHQRQ